MDTNEFINAAYHILLGLKPDESGKKLLGEKT
jgi:hypothetical protein